MRVRDGGGGLFPLPGGFELSPEIANTHWRLLACLRLCLQGLWMEKIPANGRGRVLFLLIDLHRLGLILNLEINNLPSSENLHGWKGYYSVSRSKNIPVLSLTHRSFHLIHVQQRKKICER